MNLLFAINQNHIPLFLSCVHSISIRGGADSYTIYILHSDLTLTDQTYICGAIDEKFACHFIAVPGKVFEDFPETARYPVQIYYRLAAPLLLPKNIDRILYLDVDTIIINPLMSLYDTDFEEKWFVACTHTKEFLKKCNQFRLRIEKDVPYINTGVMLMNLPELRQHLDLGAIRHFTLEHQRLLVLPDQDVLTALYGDKVKIADALRYNISDRVLILHNADPKQAKIDLDWVTENSVIIHYFGKNKPWEKNYIGILDTFYYQYGLPLKPSSEKGM